MDDELFQDNPQKDNEEQAELLAKKLRSKERRKRLLELIHAILSGKMDTERAPLSNIYQYDTSFRDMEQTPNRPHYISPIDRDSYNSQFMQVKEMPAGSPNAW